MKKIYFSLLCFYIQISFGQNLVPNPSFEDTVSCPTMLGQVTKCNSWYDVLNTPDYYNECCIAPLVGVPSNLLGYQYANKGNAYMGLYTYNGTPDPNYREIIGASLINQMNIGTKYFINFKVSFSGNATQAIRVATNKMGILFSTFPFLSTSPPINNFSQFYSDSIIADTLNWKVIHGAVIADSSYSFISIGNFYDNTHTDTIILSGIGGKAYYYIDDVCISDDSLYCELWTGLDQKIFKNDITVFPNPCQNQITIENIPWLCNEIDIINLSGITLFNLSVNKLFNTKVNLSDFPPGIYAILFKTRKSIISKKIIKL